MTCSIFLLIRCHLVEVVRHNVGLRPGREGGARLDLQEIDMNGSQKCVQLSTRPVAAEASKRAILQASGLGPAGEQASAYRRI